MNEREAQLEIDIASLERDLRYQAKCWWIGAVCWFALAAFNIAHLVMEHPL